MQLSDLSLAAKVTKQLFDPKKESVSDYFKTTSSEVSTLTESPSFNSAALFTVMFYTSWFIPNSTTELKNPAMKNEAKELLQADLHKPTQVRDANKVKKNPLSMFNHLVRKVDSAT